jgi:hypothetical protein
MPWTDFVGRCDGWHVSLPSPLWAMLTSSGTASRVEVGSNVQLCSMVRADGLELSRVICYNG